MSAGSDAALRVQDPVNGEIREGMHYWFWPGMFRPVIGDRVVGLFDGGQGFFIEDVTFAAPYPDSNGFTLLSLKHFGGSKILLHRTDLVRPEDWVRRALEPIKSAICPCGISRVDCDYHRA